MISTIFWFLIIVFGALVANRLNALTTSGAIAAIIVGALILLGFGIKGLVLLGGFFVSATFFSKWKKKYKTDVEDRTEKGDKRDWLQVIANGGVATGISFFQLADANDILTILFAIALAAASSDTWASEIGTLSKNSPLSITTFKKVDRGTSGAISLLGTTASIAGSTFIALLAYFLFDFSLQIVLIIAIFGFLGSLVDTVLGALVQVKYECQICGKNTEKKFHCHTIGKQISGFSFITNDIVNLSSIIISVLVGSFFLF